MRKFILGYKSPLSLSDNLIEYATKQEAVYDSDEWCEVEAETLEEAKEKYRYAFADWQNNAKKPTVSKQIVDCLMSDVDRYKGNIQSLLVKFFEGNEFLRDEYKEWFNIN